MNVVAKGLRGAALTIAFRPPTSRVASIDYPHRQSRLVTSLLVESFVHHCLGVPFLTVVQLLPLLSK
jgi:hypothetical protein